MERQIRRLGVALMVLFVIAFAQVNYLQVFAADRIADDPANAQRQLIAEYKVDRGSILAADGTTVLASSRKSPGDLRFQRRYPHGELYAHETGFYSFVFGRTELEQAFNDFLAGDAPELLQQTLTDLILGRPKQGATIVTTLVPEIQEAAAAAAAAEAGDVAIAAIDPATGDVLALVSEPTYDPNLLASQDPKVVRDSWEVLNEDPDKPLLSRASDELFPPGSTFKLVTASAALENGFGPDSLWPNPNELDLPLTDATIENFGGSTCSGGSQITLADALRQSCNVVFGEVGLELGADALAEQAREYGFTAEPGEDLVPFDIPWTSGVFPAPETFAEREPAVAISAIGQQDVAANPLQMALVAAAIGNGGVEMQPRLVTEARDPTGQVIAEFAPQEFSQPLSAANAAALTQMMVGVVESGTGTAAQIPGVTVAGKTGTAQHGEGANPHAWFVSFAPAEAPEVAVAVIVLDGGSLSSEATGGQLAAPIARAVLEAALGV
ncbi:MAG: penicillin-binding protein 2 [Actinobacteria bacterium]|jgi:peptidoglycan glycosyltransferase|nr:MAG: penicillin-binding protein 2 [Actinomycetota bacterium]